MATPQAAGIGVLARQAYAQLLGAKLTNTEIKRMLAALGQPQNSTSGYGPLTWPMVVEWLSTEYGVEVPGPS